jgi:hypothetical protein
MAFSETYVVEMFSLSLNPIINVGPFLWIV